MTYDCTPSNSHEGPTKCSPTWSRGTALWLAVIILHTAPNTLSTIRLFLRDCATVKRDRRISGYLLHTRREWEKQRLYSFQGPCLTVATSIQTRKQGDSVSVGKQCTHSYDFIYQIWCNYKSRSYTISTSANDCLQYEIVEKLGSWTKQCWWKLLSDDVPNPRNVYKTLTELSSQNVLLLHLSIADV